MRCIPLLIILAHFGALFAADGARPLTIEAEELETDCHRVADPGASGKLSLAVSLAKATGGSMFDLPETVFAPGRYRALVRIRSPRLNDTLVAGTDVTLTLRAGDEVLASRPAGRFAFSSPDQYEDLPLTFLLPHETSICFTLSWTRTAEVSAASVAEAAPTTPDIATAGTRDEPGDMDPGTIELELKDVTFPCLLVDRIVVERLGGDVVIERVWPKKIHCAPGKANPIDVELRNVSGRAQRVRVRVSVITGIDERSVLAERAVELAGAKRSDLRFDWQAGDREYGHEVLVEVLQGDRTLDRASEYFGVSRNIWQVSIQAPGFIEWVPQENELDDKVKNDRRGYTNVYEAFSWAPCSFTDLTPDTDEWWSGQNNFHNHIRVLRRWMELAHDNGMKMITYSWPSASGTIGMEFARQHPDWITNWQVGLGISFMVRDLRWRRWARARGKPFLATVSRRWHSAGIDRGNLAALDYGAMEIVRSAKTLGWDGVRFDAPWRWGALGGEYVQQQFEQMGIQRAGQKLYPDLYGKKDKWTADEVSYRNIKWAKHRMSEAIPTFVFSYNYGIKHDESGAKAPRSFAEACAGGGQIMNERLRQYGGPWEQYTRFIMAEADIVRGLGGHFVMCGLSKDGVTELDRIYMKIFTLTGRAHPYLYTYQWGASPTGTYSQFATRYSELLWHPDWTGIEDAREVFDVRSSAPIWWRRHATWRVTEDGLQVLLHLIAEPPTEKPYQSAKALPPRQQDVRVTFRGFRDGKRVLAARAFTAEPHTRAIPVKLETHAVGTVIVVPEHHYWTVLLLELGK